MFHIEAWASQVAQTRKGTVISEEEEGAPSGPGSPLQAKDLSSRPRSLLQDQSLPSRPRVSPPGPGSPLSLGDRKLPSE